MAVAAILIVVVVVVVLGKAWGTDKLTQTFKFRVIVVGGTSNPQSPSKWWLWY